MSSENDKDVKLTGLQKAMARKMIASWTDVPQFQLESEVNCEAMMAFRKKQDYKLSYTAILAKAAADTLAEFPRLNSSWAGDHIVEHEDINIGIAVDTKRGLLVPVISNADRKSLEEIMEELFFPEIGANFTICRMPVGANDFSRDWYSYNETDGDFEMKYFTIANDQQTLIPFIKSAQKYNSDLRIWASLVPSFLDEIQ